MALPVQIEFQESHIKRFISPAHNLLRPYDPVSTVTLRGPFVRRWRSNALGPRRKLAREMNNEAPLIYSTEFSIDSRDKYRQTFLFIPHFERYIFETMCWQKILILINN